AGILPPGNPGRATEPGDLLRAHSAVLFPHLSAELQEQTGIDNGFRRCGGLEFDGDGAAVDRWRQEGIAFERLRQPELRRLEPGLAPGLTEAYFLPDMAQVRNPRHLKALLAACASRGVRLRPGCCAVGFDVGGGIVTAVKTLDGPRTADRFLLATGAWT